MSTRNKPKNQRFLIVMLAALGGSMALMASLIWHSANESPIVAAAKNTVVVYKNSSCGCCGQWVKHLQDNGFTVEVHDTLDGDVVRTKLGVPAVLGSCHTATVNGYVIEGHVPARDIQRLLAEKPPVTGLAVPGMPEGSPGMEGPHPEAYNVMAFSPSGQPRVFAAHAVNSPP